MIDGQSKLAESLPEPLKDQPDAVPVPRVTEDPPRDRSPVAGMTGDQWRGSLIGLGIALGAGIGAAIGAATDNIPTWLPVGIGVGVALSAGLASRRKGA